jgi:hypothetical protein
MHDLQKRSSFERKCVSQPIQTFLSPCQQTHSSHVLIPTKQQQQHHSHHSQAAAAAEVMKFAPKKQVDQ